MGRAQCREQSRALYFTNGLFRAVVDIAGAFLVGDNLTYGRFADPGLQAIVEDFWEANSFAELVSERLITEWFLDGEIAAVFPSEVNGDRLPGRRPYHHLVAQAIAIPPEGVEQPSIDRVPGAEPIAVRLLVDHAPAPAQIADQVGGDADLVEPDHHVAGLLLQPVARPKRSVNRLVGVTAVTVCATIIPKLIRRAVIFYY